MGQKMTFFVKRMWFPQLFLQFMQELCHLVGYNRSCSKDVQFLEIEISSRESNRSRKLTFFTPKRKPISQNSSFDLMNSQIIYWDIHVIWTVLPIDVQEGFKILNFILGVKKKQKNNVFSSLNCN